MIDAIQELYAAGIDCGLESFQGQGLTAWVVDRRNRRIEKRFDVAEMGAISEWLFERAVELDDTTPASHTARSPRELVAELANSRRKDARRVTAHERQLRREGGAPVEQHRLSV